MVRRSHRPWRQRKRARWPRWLALLLALAVLAAFAFVPPLLDRQLNRVAGPPVGIPSSHATLRIADLHADSLLWSRDLAEHLDHGHVDVPRLVSGNVALQVFGVVTQVPLGLNFERNESDAYDLITAIAVVQRWSPATWTS